MQDTCGIHLVWLRGNQDTFLIWDTCGLHVGYMRDTYLGGLGECIDAIIVSSNVHVSLCIQHVSRMYLLCHVSEG